jgi:hypothetical protein
VKANSTFEAPRAQILPTKLRDVSLPVPKLKLGNWAAGDKAAAVGGGLLTSATFTLSTDVGAAVVWLETSLEGRFSDNAFVLDAGSSRSITFFAAQYPLAPFRLEQLQTSITVRSLRDSYTDTDTDAGAKDDVQQQHREKEQMSFAFEPAEPESNVLQHRSGARMPLVQAG